MLVLVVVLLLLAAMIPMLVQLTLAIPQSVASSHLSAVLIVICVLLNLAILLKDVSIPLLIVPMAMLAL
jgi:hypothetical protein